MKPLPSRLESFWIGVIAGIVLALALVPMIAKAGLTDSISTFHETERHLTMRNDR